MKKKMPKIIIGNHNYDENFDYSEVEEITGYLNCLSAKEVNIPQLTTIGGSLDFGSAKEVNIPQLTTIGGYLYCGSAKVSLPKLTTIGGYLDCGSAKVSFPKLTTIGGYLDCGSAKVSLPKLKYKNDTKRAKARVRSAFRRKGFVLFDGILAEIIDTKTRAYGSLHKLRVVGSHKVSFCIEANGVFSHGDTVKEARESLLYKISNRDKSAYEGWTLDKVITKKQAIESYRVITGACESGTRHFVEKQGELKCKYTVAEIIQLTDGQFGNDEYRAFFDKQALTKTEERG